MKTKKITILTIIIVIIGLISVYSSSYIWALYKYDDALYYIKRQMIFAVLGFIAMFVTSRIDYHLYKKYYKFILIICFLLLILVLIPGLGVVRGGSRSWFHLGFFALQPSELFKIGIIIYTAVYIEKHYYQMKKIRYSFKVLLMMGLGFLLIMMQPDFGSAVVMACAIVVMMIVSPFPFRYFVGLGIVGVIGIMIMILSAPYRMERILSFLDPFQDPLGSGFQIIQSLYAIGPGGLFGFGLGSSRQKHFYLPEPQTDFIFSIISEEFGFMGVLIVSSLFFFIIYKSIKIALKCEDLFGKYLAFGIVFILAFQATLNLSVVIGLLPVTGVTLPFLSYGGSSLLITLASMGIILNISKQNK